jgi:hypothetical protein
MYKTMPENTASGIWSKYELRNDDNPVENKLLIQLNKLMLNKCTYRIWILINIQIINYDTKMEAKQQKSQKDMVYFQ